MPLILASNSPRRQALLQQVGLDFSVLSVTIDEAPKQQEGAADYVQRMALEKSYAALEALKGLHHGNMIDHNQLVITADTIGVVIPEHHSTQEVILVKPENLVDAKRMWQLMSGTTHTVMTAVCVASFGSDLPCKRLQELVKTDVEFVPLTETMQMDYWHTGEPQDKAGAYAIQGRGAAWVKRINGSYTNVVGLPLVETLAMIDSLHSSKSYK